MTKQQVTSSEVAPLYSTMAEKCRQARQLAQRSLTLAEKILFAHLHGWNGSALPVRGQSNVFLRPDRVAMQDATAQMALLQFMQAGLDKVYVPTTVHCDHLIQAKSGAKLDLLDALNSNSEVYDFLRTAAARYGAGFWKPGAGIIHQVILESYAFPGSLLIGTDSHTPNAGGLGMLAIGVGGADAVFTMAGEPWGLKWPRLFGVKLTGSLSGWAAPKDIILKLAGMLTVKGGTGAIIEYFGPGTKSICATGKATICNMGAELGATTSVFPFDEHMAAYLKLTGRAEIAAQAEKVSEHLVADADVESAPQKYFDQVIEIDLDKLEPHVVGPHTPDLARPISALKQEVEDKKYPANLRYALIGSCTNSSYEDMTRAAAVAKQAAAHGLKAPIGFMVTPGSEQVYKTIERDGQLGALQRAGAQVLANACGPCIGQWKRGDIKDGEANSIITSFNRNFPRRNDGNAQTLAFIASPELVTAFALKGDLSFNPLTDTLVGADGKEFKLDPPPAAGLPVKGFSAFESGFIDPSETEMDGQKVSVAIKPESTRLHVLAPFAKWDGKDVRSLPVLLKAAGKCTTDHISPAGPWLKFRGHLDRISDNMFLGANNAFSATPGTGVNVLTGKTDTLSAVARQYKEAGLGWVAIGDENYGEGSSREHAAMSPRFLGCRVVLARSFARIHETNLKQQGLLALTFANPKDYDRIQAEDRITIENLGSLAPGLAVAVQIEHKDGSIENVAANHTMTEEQIGWFKAGSALNLVSERRNSESEDASSVPSNSVAPQNSEHKKETHPMSEKTASFSAGLEGVIACTTRLSDVDGLAGRLILSGVNAVDVAETRTVEEVWYLLHQGRLPSQAELAAFKADVEAFGKPSPKEVRLMKSLRAGEPLSAFRTIISAISAHRGYKPWLNREPAVVAREIRALQALAPAIVEVIHTGKAPLKKKGNAGYAERYLWGILRRKPDAAAVRALETYLILTMDHGLNASTFAGRVTASTGADVGAALTAAVATLSGPLHGGAPGPVLDMLDAIGEPANAKRWVKAQIDAKRRIMGFGHRVYRTDDPRALTLRRVAERQQGPRIELAKVVEQTVLATLAEHQEQKAKTDGKQVRALRVNVEFWTAVVLEHVGIPRELYSSTFCAARILGWGEHIAEQLNNNKLFRPLSLYTGPVLPQ